MDRTNLRVKKIFSIGENEDEYDSDYAHIVIHTNGMIEINTFHEEGYIRYDNIIFIKDGEVVESRGQVVAWYPKFEILSEQKEEDGFDVRQ